MEQAVVNYLIRLAAQSKLSDERDISRLHGSLADIMRIAEIADNLTKYTRASVDRNLDFSQSVRQELDGMTQRVEELYGLTRRVMVEKDAGLLGEVDRVENDVDTLRKRLIESHIERLNQGACSAASSGVFINLVSNLERLGDHLTYIAHSTVE